MNMKMRNITVQLALTQYGDALIYGVDDRDDYMPGVQLKQMLFAWHEESFYGTELSTSKADEVELVVLPAEQVLPFFADLRLLRHVGWSWQGDAQLLTRLAPLLAGMLEARQYAPSFAAYREGQLRWAWEEQVLAEAAEANWDDAAALHRLQERSGFAEGLQAAFSAAVFQRHYSTEAQAGDLRSEFPLLFSAGGRSAAGMDEDSWLMSIGWKADTAPFRPVLQLLEPDDELPHWRLQLLLQDKRDESALVPLRLTGDGEPHGTWPAAWTAHVHERAGGWLSRLRDSLPEAHRARRRCAGRTAERRGRVAVPYGRQPPPAGGWLAGAAAGVVGSRQPQEAAPAREDQLRHG